jgi:hypothetical protein
LYMYVAVATKGRKSNESRSCWGFSGGWMVGKSDNPTMFIGRRKTQAQKSEGLRLSYNSVTWQPTLLDAWFKHTSSASSSVEWWRLMSPLSPLSVCCESPAKCSALHFPLVKMVLVWVTLEVPFN